ncbi:MAG: pyrimidine oxygenase [Rhodobacteraceae bacterium HLUCCA24]|nr:MAG: pyrimidine oxygenase [Rhodobacteraceae bacterium HLUCCA24]
MSKTIDVGVFIPVGNHGWIHSTNSPAVEDGSFPRVLEITQRAEALGFDFVLSPGIWRGRKGPSRHWMDSLESLTTSAALLQATEKIGVFATMHMTVYQPAIIAKMMGTLDQIGPGRVGLNLVTGSSYLDLAHVGLWRDGLSHEERYDLADEWIKVVKQLWTEDVTSHKGDFFELVEATMGPKPSRLPPLANAGASPRGFRFAVENCDIAFIGSGEDEKYVQLGRNAKATARDMGKPELKVYGLLTVIPGETNEAAKARLAHFDAGVDLECLEDIARGYDMNPNVKDVSAASKRLAGEGRGSAVSSGAMTGSYDGLAKRIARVVTDGELDGIILIVPDYVEDLRAVAGKTLARMADHGVTCRVSGH